MTTHALSRQLLNYRYCASGVLSFSSQCRSQVCMVSSYNFTSSFASQTRLRHVCSLRNDTPLPDENLKNAKGSRFMAASGVLTANLHTSATNLLPRGYNSDVSPVTPRNVNTSLPIDNNQPALRRDSPLTQKLISARSTQEIVDILDNDSDVLNLDAVSVSVAVDSLFDSLRNDRALSTKRKHQLLTTVGVQKLCKVLRRSAPHMDPGDIINGVKLLTLLSAPGSHVTLQVLLKLLSKHANLLDLQQLVYTQFLLDKMDGDCKSALSKALEYTLPVVFESQLNSQIDSSDPQSICDYLHYATRYKLSEKSINLLVDAALRITDRIPTKLAMSMMWSLCDTKFDNPSHEPLVNWCFRKLTDHMDDFKLNDLKTVMGKVVRKYNSRSPYFYNENFLTSYCQRIIQNDVDAYDTVWSIKSVSIFRHVNIEHIDRIGDILAANPSIILNDDRLFVTFIKSISNFNYRPEKWPAIAPILLEHPALVPNKHLGAGEVPLAVNFLALEMFPDNLIHLLFSAEGLHILEAYKEKHHPILLILLYNAVKILHPGYKGPFPPVTMVESWKEKARALAANVHKYPLKGALQTGLGGESYVINGLFHDGLHIDHGIVMRKGGYPVAVNSQSDSQSDCLSSISKPPESIIVLVKCFTPDLYANNTRRLRGTASLELKILENLGHPVVSVDQQMWIELPDHEKIPYLMQRIRGKMEYLQWNQNWGDVVPP